MACRLLPAVSNTFSHSTIGLTAGGIEAAALAKPLMSSEPGSAVPTLAAKSPTSATTESVSRTARC